MAMDDGMTGLGFIADAISDSHRGIHCCKCSTYAADKALEGVKYAADSAAGIDPNR